MRGGEAPASYRAPMSERVTAIRGQVALVAVVLVSGLVVLGPALGRGVVIAYDMPWSPDPRWTPFVLGLDTPAPRAVPSDAVAVAVGKVLGGAAAQHAVLLGILCLLGLGAARLARQVDPSVSAPAACAAALLAIWNPFVAERLAVGQWVVILGLAVLPWALAAALRRTAGEGPLLPVLGWVALASVGGVNALLVVAGSVLLVLLVSPGARTRAGEIVLTALVAIGGAAAWALPALFSSLPPSGEGVSAFAPRSDSPLGVLGSLLAGGGFWNAAVHPSARASVVVALASAALAVAAVGCVLYRAKGRGRRGLLAVLVVWGLVMAMSVLPGTSEAWQLVVDRLPGGGALRDSQKLVAPWVVVAAAGVGLLVDSARRLPRLGVPLQAMLLCLPIALSPQMAWGLGGRLTAVEVPTGYRAAVDRLAELPDGEVALLPWSQYRQYGWNDDRVSLTLVPRIVDRAVVFDDSLPLRAGRVPGESPRSREIARAIDRGAAPEDVLAGSGARYLVAELDAGLPVDVDRLRSHGLVVAESPEIIVIDLGGPSEQPGPTPGRVLLGWGVTLLTWVVVTGALIASRSSVTRGALLISSRA